MVYLTHPKKSTDIKHISINMVLLNVLVFNRVKTITYFIEKGPTDFRLRQDLGLTRVSPKVVQSLSENEVVYTALIIPTIRCL